MTCITFFLKMIFRSPNVCYLEYDFVWRPGLSRGNWVKMRPLSWVSALCGWCLYKKERIWYRDNMPGGGERCEGTRGENSQNSSWGELARSHSLLRAYRRTYPEFRNCGTRHFFWDTLRFVKLSCVSTSRTNKAQQTFELSRIWLMRALLRCLVISDKGSWSCTFRSILFPGSTLKTCFALYNRDVVTENLHLSEAWQWGLGEDTGKAIRCHL